MTKPKAHELHEAHTETVKDQKHDPTRSAADGGAHAAGEAAPKGTPSSERHQTETVKPDRAEG